MKQYDREIHGLPAGLYVLFFSEMWERFSYYGMRSILVYYMIKHLGFTQEYSSHVYGMYTGLVYFTPILGGLLADRVIGQSRAVVWGAILMATGHFLLAFERLFYPALVFLILGNGAFKPNISTQVGALYARDDARRDRAFSIFYVGINLGAFFSPLVCGTLGEVYGWHYGFGAAGVGMLIGLGVYLWGRRFLAPDWTAAAAACDKEPSRSSDSPRESTGRSGIGVLFLVCAVTTAFWAVYEQQGNTIALWADSQTDRMILGWEIPASWVQSLNPALVFIITPFLTWFWGKQAARGKEPSAPGKMAIGCFLAAAAFLVLAPAGAMHGETSGGAGLGWIFVFTLLLTVGELYLSPIGLSYVTKIAPARMVSMLMGVWLMSAFFGNIGSGFLGSFWEKMPKDTFFLLMAGIASVAGALLVCINRFRPKGSS